ncbi:MAG: hypothetical protein JRE82_12405 [Deltaproteobacteria bacterium]|nr:hypothetical protein [Deltaproteobacteria bacterium]
MAVLSILGFGCSSADGGSSGGSGGSDANDMVRAERFFTPGFVPEANPETSEDTPTELNQARVVRYFMADEPAQAPRAILIAMPGFLGGGPSFDGIARSSIQRDGGPDGHERCGARGRRGDRLGLLL